MRVHLQHSGGGTGSARNRRKQRHRARTGSTRIHSPPPSYSKVHSDLLLCFMQIFDFCIVNFSKQVYFFLHQSNDGKVSLNRFYCRTYSTWFIALKCFAYLSCSLHILHLLLMTSLSLDIHMCNIQARSVILYVKI